MKPILLIIDGINSFSERQEIDFRFNGLFCISGDTGSGKTTILDCIIIALYGSGKRVSVASDYINLKRDRAEIKLVFETDCDGQRQAFEVTRILVRDGAARAKLVNLTTGETVAETAGAVNSALENMIGLTRDDFTQVVILEQGKFSKFLTASKKERNETVGNLFKLHKYKDLGSKFASGMKIIKGELDSLDKRLDELKDITSASVHECEKSIKDMNKRLRQLEEDEKREAEELVFLEEAKRRFVKCQEAEIKLNAAVIEKEKLSAEVKVLRENVENGEMGLKNANEQKANYELIQARNKDLSSLIDEKRKRSEALSMLREEWRKASEEEKNCKSEYDTFVEKTQNLSIMLNSRISDIFKLANLGEKDGYCDVFDIKIKVDRLVVEFDMASSAYDDFDKNVKTCNEKVRMDTDNLSAIMERVNKAYDKKEKLKKDVAELKLKREKEQRDEAAEFIKEGLKEGDTCPVCGGIVGIMPLCLKHSITLDELAKKEKECAEAEKYYNELENNRYSFATRLDESLKAAKEANKKFIEAKERLAKCESIVKAENIDKLITTATEACELKNSLADWENKSSLAAQKRQVAIERTADIKARGEVERSEVDRLKAIIDERLNISEEELKHNDLKLKEAVANVEKLSNDLLKQRTTLEQTAAKLAAAETTIMLLKAEVSDKPQFDARLLDDKMKSLAGLKKEKELLIAKIASSEKELEVMKRDIEQKRKLEHEKLDKKKAYDIYADIYKLVSGDKFIEYIAEEYILQFTSSASIALSEITGGKYTLEYINGAFYVKDFLAGGMERKANTLSGGETFLASLSLAIAISREIARYKTYEFFFLDEGFGTLDAGSLDTVINALTSLSSDTLVGVVTHRSEITDRIFDKITVLSAEAGHGSRIVRSD